MPHPHAAGHPHASGHPHGAGHPHGTARPGGGLGPMGMKLDYDKAPFLVIWETTQACDLACRHCRAEAQPNRDPDELTAEQGKKLLEDIRRFGPLIVVFSGGDALKRPDIVELVAHGSQLGLRMAITPATTPLASKDTLQALKDAGLSRLAVSLDGSNPGIHDDFRRVSGSFEHGLRILEQAQEVGLTTQVNTVIRKNNLDDIDRMCELMAKLGIVFWEVFFLVPMGRAKPEDVASAEGFEEVFEKLYELSKTAPFDIKATAAPQYSRVVMQHKLAEQRAAEGDHDAPADLDVLTSGAHHSDADGIGRARNVNDGDGFLFVSHTGEIYPSGFLPVSAGNVKTDDLVDVYRTAPLFTELRDRSNLKGKCQVCQFRNWCGGSRARAFAMTGDMMAAEPFCAHVPTRYQLMVDAEGPAPLEKYYESSANKKA